MDKVDKATLKRFRQENEELHREVIRLHHALSELKSSVTLRDYFAAAALQGSLAYKGTCHQAGVAAYEMADAMLAARERENKKERPTQ
jgi:cell division septum initiation protein DivIVA